MKYKELKDITVDELAKKGREMREELFQTKMKNSLGQAGNPLLIRKLRKDIARVETAIRTKR